DGLFVWKMFLIRFSFIWELVYGGSNGNNNKSLSEKVSSTPLRRSSRMKDIKSRKC
ncbi:small integral membrane protein 13, partial [Desmophyllum pertusum]